MPKQLTPEEMRAVVERGYDTGDYAGTYRLSTALCAFEQGMFMRFQQLIPSQGTVLDWGSGSGIPYDLHLVDQGYHVLGVDISQKHVDAARRNVPGARYVKADFSRYNPSDAPYDGLICLYALFHLPRPEHAATLKRAYDLLRPGGVCLITMGVNQTGEVDCESNWCGADEMAWSHYDAATNLCMVQGVGFRVLASINESDHGSSEQHLWVLMQKPSE